jgi:two-component system cell cycle response regulator
MKILLAEDDAVSRRILDVTLRRLGHEVIEAGNGREAWKAFQAGDIDVVRWWR